MIFETAIISCCAMPSMYDFTEFVKNITNLSQNIKIDTNIPTIEKTDQDKIVKEETTNAPNISNNPSKRSYVIYTLSEEKPENPADTASIGKNENIEQKPAPETAQNKPKSLNWVDFCKTFKDKDPYFYGIISGCKYTENDTRITVSILNEIQRGAINDLQQEFGKFFGSAKELEFVDYEDGTSILADEEAAKKEEIANKKNMILESKAVKSAQELGFQLKKVSVE